MAQPRLVAPLLLVLALFAPVADPPPLLAQTAEMLEALAELEGEDFMYDPAEIFGWVEVAPAARVGEEILLAVTLQNHRADAPFRLTSIDLLDEYLDGFEAIGFDPEPRHRDHSFGSLTLDFPIDLAPGEKRRFEIRLRAKTPGVYIGDVDVYEGNQFLTRAAQTVVLGPGRGGG